MTEKMPIDTYLYVAFTRKLTSDPFKLRFFFPTFPFWRSSTVSPIVPKKSCFQPVFESKQIANPGKTAV